MARVSAGGSNYNPKTGQRQALSQIVFDQYSEGGYMTAEQLKRLCKDKDFDCEEVELDAAFVRMDADETGFIEYPEFLEWWKKQDEYGDRMEALRYQSPEEKHRVQRARSSFLAITGGLNFMTREQFQGYCLSEWELDDAMQELDKDGSGYVEFNEYLRWRVKDDRFAHLQHKDDEDEQSAYIHQVVEFFRQYDAELKGFLTVEQFSPLYDSLVEAGDVTAPLEECLAQVDSNGDRQVSLNEFIKWYATAYQEEEEGEAA
eukprot:TRINITY_DN17731_c0_g2_i5.p1 TRINITY_DN17731_c0_g2~~TRINITY_DN17731_c0_g2_i5.p1  ORF type:complete len:260 (+),score=69.23 TRINITY_DN17731_c0_g2_i5:95-874(+)